MAEQLATLVRNANITVFYDNFYPGELWGKDLPVFFDEIYRKRSRYCVILVTRAYIDGLWTNHERQSAVARALQERDEYILPIKVENVELPGVPPTVGYLSLDQYPVERIDQPQPQLLSPIWRVTTVTRHGGSCHRGGT